MNPRAQALYEKLGFVVNGETETHILMKLAHNLVMKLTFQPIIVFVLVLRYGAGVSVVAAQEEGRCAPADRFLTEELFMVTRIDPDTLDDWRTGKRLAACRITGAGARRTTLAVAARVFYERVRAAGWTRTPDPRDSPNEASLRFRLGETDCLFNVYQGILLGTDSEIEVTNAVETRPGDELYHVLVLCVPAMEARPLGFPFGAGLTKGGKAVGP